MHSGDKIMLERQANTMSEALGGDWCLDHENSKNDPRSEGMETSVKWTLILIYFKAAVLPQAFMACLCAACDSPPPDITPQRERDQYDNTSTEPADAWVCRWWWRWGVGGLPFLLLWWHLLFAVSSRWSFQMALMWCFVLRYKFAARVLLLVHDWCGHCPDPSLSQPVRLYRDRITTVPARSPQSEHAKADSGISFSESLEKPNVRLSRKTTAKRHRAPNGKNNSANKRVRRHPVWLQQWKPYNIW